MYPLAEPDASFNELVCGLKVGFMHFAKTREFDGELLEITPVWHGVTIIVIENGLGGLFDFLDNRFCKRGAMSLKTSDSRMSC